MGADRKDMEAYALESINREKANVRNEVMEKNNEMHKDLGVMADSVEQLGGKCQDQHDQFLALRSMLSNLAAFVEELVVKMAEMQGVEIEGVTKPKGPDGSDVDPRS